MEALIKTLRWKNKSLYILDQQKLPLEEDFIELENAQDVWDAIKTLKIRGAPAIGCAAAYGVALAAVNPDIKDSKELKKEIGQAIKRLKTSRPTAYNLFFALERMERILKAGKHLTFRELKDRIVREANDIYMEDLDGCRRIGLNGAGLIKNGMNILTHCNAGGLATSGIGTALAPLFEAKKRGIRFHVFVDETRPVLQGARLTAWELKKTKIRYTLICDSAAGSLMQKGKIDMVITGADRIALNGDTANKIGTYSLAVLARCHNVDFYVAAPLSTFDPAITTGKEIPVEERPPGEVRRMGNTDIAPPDTPVYNPAFDITPSRLIKGFITEKGILRQKNLKTQLKI